MQCLFIDVVEIPVTSCVCLALKSSGHSESFRCFVASFCLSLQLVKNPCLQVENLNQFVCTVQLFERLLCLLQSVEYPSKVSSYLPNQKHYLSCAYPLCLQFQGDILPKSNVCLLEQKKSSGGGLVHKLIELLRLLG